MRRKREKMLGGAGRVNCYHVVSRVVNREIVFGDLEKEKFREILDKQLEFSGLRLLAWCLMGNHFHLLLQVPDKEKALAGWGEEDFISRLSVLGDEAYTRQLFGNVKMWRGNGCDHLVRELAERVRGRLFDLSSFMKEVKQKFSAWFNLTRGRKGTLWEERFRSVLVEGTGGWSKDGLSGLLAVAAYIDLNPVRAGIVDDPKGYRWCGYAAAVAGNKASRSGLATCAGKARNAGWRTVGAAYRKVLYAAGEARDGGRTPDGSTVGRRGFTQAEIEAVWKAGGRLSLGTVLRCRVTYFTQGLAIGRRRFVEGYGKDAEGRARSNEIRGADLGGLRFFGTRDGQGIRAPG